jgi:hypothetical protein
MRFSATTALLQVGSTLMTCLYGVFGNHKDRTSLWWRLISRSQTRSSGPGPPTRRRRSPPMRHLGVGVVMLTRDNAIIVAAIARATGVRRVVAEVLPEHKASKIQRLPAGPQSRRD